MDHIQNYLQKLGERLSVTSSDASPEPYILTKDDEDKLIGHAIAEAQKLAVWKMRQLLMGQNEIDAKINLIDWNGEIDRDEILQRANMVKNHEIWQKEQRVKEREEEKRRKQELKELWTAKRMYQHMSWVSQNEYGKKLVVNSDNREFITALCYFISRDEKFETDLKFSLNKGLLIRGISGIGKTHLVKCLEANELNPILVLSMLDIAEEIKERGEYQIKSNNHKIVYLDDVGSEEAVINHYGTKINFFKTFIESVYLRAKSFNHLIFSTNNSFDEIEERYGFRVRSRLKDMFNVIEVYGHDMRG